MLILGVKVFIKKILKPQSNKKIRYDLINTFLSGILFLLKIHLPKLKYNVKIDLSIDRSI